MAPGAIIESDIPARLDRLPWGRFHTLVVVALGVTWILDGLEVTLAGSLAGALKDSPVLRFTNAEVGLAASAYLAGAVLGALFFGWLTDRLGRKKLFFITLASISCHRGDRDVLEPLELCVLSVPHRRRHRGRIRRHQFDHPGTDPGARARLVRSRHQRQLLGGRGHGRARLIGGARSRRDQSGNRLAARLPDRRGPRAGHFLHAAVAAGKPALADDARPRRRGPPRDRRHRGALCRAAAGARSAAGEAARAQVDAALGGCASLFKRHPQRAFVGLSLMAAQAFFYNAIFFTYALMLTDFYGVPSDHVGWYILPFAVGNFLGPVLIGRLFDTQGRRPMIAFTYIISGVLLAGTGWLFARDLIGAQMQTICWMTIFFFASAAASSAYLTVSETSRWKSARSLSPSSTPSAPASAASRARRCSAI